MVEGEGCSRPTGDPRDGEAGPTKAGRGPVRGLPEPADDLPALLATLGRYLEGHAPDEVVVLLREELARREFQAYVNGWRDAADEYEPVLEEARRIAQTRRLRLVGRTPGQAAVIPFPQGEGPAESAESAGAAEDGPDTPPESPGPGAEASASAARRRRGRGGASDDAGKPPAPTPARSRATNADAAAPTARPAEAAPGGDATASQGSRHPRDRPDRQVPDQARAPEDDVQHQAPDASRAGAGAPKLVAKSRSSRVPTIPRLPARRRRPGDHP
ncbi:hypothetical protein [Streptomyces sp. NPDC003036]|uniref:hypothetical protein n=1 Tax=Streptomyces sp. NPDC003036 TaxID=3154442 RepID=UPI0033AF2C56